MLIADYVMTIIRLLEIINVRIEKIPVFSIYYLLNHPIKFG